MNQIQVIGTHNSYHREPSLRERRVFEKMMKDPQNYYYSHASLSDQLTHQSVRSLELDLHSDTHGGLYDDPLIWRLSNLTDAHHLPPFHDANMSSPGLKVFHVTDMDTNAVCHTFVECLTELRAWSVAHPHHVPLLIDLELKSDADFCAHGGVCADEARTWTFARLLEVDREIHSVLRADQLIVPDDIRRDDLTLEESVLTHGWPTLDFARGRFMFYFDNEPDDKHNNIRNLYRADGHESLQNRTVFTNSVEGEPDAAFIKYNDPRGDGQAEIQRLVRKGYIVRTRTDEPITTVQRRDRAMYDAALPSGAQVVSTDWPQVGMAARYDSDYAVQFEGGSVARCNPVNAPEWCREADLEGMRAA